MPATASGTGESAGTPLGSARPEYPRPLGRAAGPDLGAEGGHSSVFFFFFGCTIQHFCSQTGDF